MDRHVYEFSLLQLQDACNNALNEALVGLEKEGLLKVSAEEILTSYALILQRKGTLGYIWDKIFGAKDDLATRYRLVKIIDPNSNIERKEHEV